MSLLHRFETHKTAAILLMLSLWLIGLGAYQFLGKEILPPIERSFFVIESLWPKQDSHKVYSHLCQLLEKQARQTAGIYHSESWSKNGECRIVLHLDYGLSQAQRNHALNQLRYLIENLPRPKGSQKPLIIHQTPDIMLSRFNLSSEDSSITYAQLLNKAERIQAEFIQQGLSQTRLRDVNQEQTLVEVSEQALAQHQLSLASIAKTIQQSLSNVNTGLNQLDEQSMHIIVQDRHSKLTLDKQLSEVQLTSRSKLSQTESAQSVALAQVANIRSGYQYPYLSTQLDGKPSISLSVYQDSQYSIEKSQALTQASLQAIQSKQLVQHPFKLELVQDNHVFYQKRMALLQENALLGLLLVFITLCLFIPYQHAFWVCAGLPTAFIASFAVFLAFGISINMVSSFAFLLIIGVIVDDAIMLAEYKSRRHSQASTKASNAIIKPLFFAILTTAISFSPLFFIFGSEGQLVKQIPLVVISCLFFSLIECLAILPNHLYRHRGVHAQTSSSEGLLNKQLIYFKQHYYQALLKQALRYRYLTVCIFICIFALALATISSGWKPITLHSKIQAEIISLNIKLPDGSSAEHFQQVFRNIEAKALTLKNNALNQNQASSSNIRHVRSIIDKSGIQGFIYLTLSENSSQSSSELAQQLRDSLPNVPEAEHLKIEHSFTQASAHQSHSIQLALHDDDIENLSQGIIQLADFAKQQDGVSYVQSPFLQSQTRLNIQLKPLAEQLNINSQDVQQALQETLEGFQLKPQGQNISLQLPKQEKHSLWHLQQLAIPSEEGLIPLRQIAQLSFSQQAKNIYAEQGFISANITIHLKQEANKALYQQRFQDFIQTRLNPQGINSLSIKAEQEQTRLIQSLTLGFIIAIGLMYIVMGLLFNSFSQPLLILSAIPFGLVGSFLGHLLLLEPLTIWSITGMIAVSGIVVNDNIVLVHFINQQLQDNPKQREQAIINACLDRFKPVLLTTLTSFIGLLPMLLEQSFETQFLKPMAISISFGVLFATAISLLLVPALYLLRSDAKQLSFSPKPA